MTIKDILDYVEKNTVNIAVLKTMLEALVEESKKEETPALKSLSGK